MITQVPSLANTQVKNSVLLKNTQKGSNIKTSAEVQKNPDAVMEAMNFAGAQNKVSFGALNGREMNQAIVKPLNKYISGLESFGMVKRFNSSFAAKIRNRKLLEMDDEKLLKVIKNDESLKDLYEAIGGRFLTNPQMDMVKSVNENPQNFTTPISFVDNHNKSMSTMREYLRTYVDEISKAFEERSASAMGDKIRNEKLLELNDEELYKRVMTDNRLAGLFKVMGGSFVQQDEQGIKKLTHKFEDNKTAFRTMRDYFETFVDESAAANREFPKELDDFSLGVISNLKPSVMDSYFLKDFNQTTFPLMANKVRNGKLTELADKELYDRVASDSDLLRLFKALGGSKPEKEELETVEVVKQHPENFYTPIPFIKKHNRALSALREYLGTFDGGVREHALTSELDKVAARLKENISSEILNSYFAEKYPATAVREMPKKVFSYKLSTPAKTETPQNLNDYLNSAAYREKVSAEKFAARTSSPMANRVRDEKLLEMSDSRLTETVENDELLYDMYKSLGGRKLSKSERSALAFLTANASNLGSLAKGKGLCNSVLGTKMANDSALNSLRDYFRSFVYNMESHQGRFFNSLDEAVRNANML